jgi:hypothetical protein
MLEVKINQLFDQLPMDVMMDAAMDAAHVRYNALEQVTPAAQPGQGAMRINGAASGLGGSAATE